MHSWESIAQLQNKEFPQTITNALMDTMVADKWTGACDQGVVSYKFSVFKLWCAKYGSNRLRELDETYFEKIDTMEEWGSPRLVTEGQIQHYESKMKEICLGRKFFTTAKGGM